MSCPCGAKWHPLESHPERVLVGWHPVFGYYRIDDVIFEHAQGWHTDNADPECCEVCAASDGPPCPEGGCMYWAIDENDLREHLARNH